MTIEIMTAIISGLIGAIITLIYFLIRKFPKKESPNKKNDTPHLTQESLTENSGLPPTIPTWLFLVKSIYTYNKALFKEFVTNDHLILNIPTDNGKVYKNQSNFIKNQLVEELMEELPQSSILEDGRPQGQILNYITNGEIN